MNGIYAICIIMYNIILSEGKHIINIPPGIIMMFSFGSVVVQCGCMAPQ